MNASRNRHLSARVLAVIRTRKFRQCTVGSQQQRLFEIIHNNRRIAGSENSHNTFPNLVDNLDDLTRDKKTEAIALRVDRRLLEYVPPSFCELVGGRIPDGRYSFSKLSRDSQERFITLYVMRARQDYYLDRSHVIISDDESGD